MRRAIESARKDAGMPKQWFELEMPLTPEVVSMASGIDPVGMFKFK